MGGLNMSGRCIACEEKPAPPRVVVVGLASCFGCQLQITNAESHLLDVLGLDAASPEWVGAGGSEEFEAALGTFAQELLRQRAQARADKILGEAKNTSDRILGGLQQIGQIGGAMQLIGGEAFIPQPFQQLAVLARSFPQQGDILDGVVGVEHKRRQVAHATQPGGLLER